MSKKCLLLFLSGQSLAAASLSETELSETKFFPLNGVNSTDLADIAPDAEFVLCPGGALRPISGGIYALDSQAQDDASSNRYGLADYNRVMEQAATAAKVLGVPAYFTDAMSTDELLPLNRVRSHASVVKYSRSFRCEHLAAICTLSESAPENGNYIVAWIDDIVSIGAYRHGRCIDANDCLGGEGPMGFTSSGDVPCAQLAKYFASHPISFEDLQHQLLTNSGILQYLGTGDPKEVNALCRRKGEAAAVVDAFVYQVAKWIGICALDLQGHIDGILITGKGTECDYLLQGISKKVGRIAPVLPVPDVQLDRWLAKKAMLLGSFAAPVSVYGKEVEK